MLSLGVSNIWNKIVGKYWFSPLGNWNMLTNLPLLDAICTTVFGTVEKFIFWGGH